MHVHYVSISLGMQMRNKLYAFNNTAMVLIEQLIECLVHKPLQAASMSADHVCDWANVQKWSFLADKRSFEGKWQKFQDNLSAKEIITRNTSMPEVGSYNS